MYGEKGRIGLIVPSNNTVVEQEFLRMLPEGITSYATRMRNTKADMSDLEMMVTHAARGADELSTAEVDVIAFACTAGSLLHGIEWEQSLRRDLEKASAGIPCITTSQAVTDAFRHLGLRRLVVATPYIDELNQAEKHFFEADGFEVLDIRGLGIRRAADLGRCYPKEAMELALRLPYQKADGIFISCTNFRTIDILSELEEWTEKPALSSNLATLWAALKHLPKGCGPIRGFGRLLESHHWGGTGRPS
jgi:maleate isomerase